MPGLTLLPQHGNFNSVFSPKCVFFKKKKKQNLDIITNRFFQTKIDFQNPDFFQILYVFQIPFSIICKE